MSNTKKLKPVGKNERIHVLDALRGFAIFGILIINIRVFSGYSFMPSDIQETLLLSDWNAIFDWIHIVFFSGKFYTLFSLLFGIGFAIQLIRAQQADRSFNLHFSKRLFFLILFGIVHLWGIWFSDILVLYAICGYFLILFKGLSNRSLLIAAFIIMLLPGIHSYFLYTSDYFYTDTVYLALAQNWAELNLPSTAQPGVFQMEDIFKVIQSDSWNTVFNFNYIGPLLRSYLLLLDARLFKVLAIFVLGFWTGRQLLNNRLHENRSLLVKITTIGILFGIPLNIAYQMHNPFGFSSPWHLIVSDGLAIFGFVALTSAYTGLFMLLYLTDIKKLFIILFNDVGRMALTNYILQSILGILLFYEVGLGLWKYFGSAYLTLSVFIIFGVQILLSKLWLKRYKYGPLEWLWRVLTYGSFMKNRQVNEN